MIVAANQKEINDFLYQLYQDTQTSQVSIKYRQKHNIDQESFVYGDSCLLTLSKILNEVNPKPGEVFYDLGSGGGRVVLFAALGFPFAKSIGIEFIEDLVFLAQKKLMLMHETLPNLPNFDANKLGEINFIQKDFIKADTRDADIICAASTCYDDRLIEDLATLLEEQVKVGTRVITCTKSIPSKHFKIHKKELHQMEWGNATVYFQEKI